MPKTAEAARAETASLLRSILSREYILLTMLRGFRWELAGPEFAGLRELLGAHERELSEAAEELDRRVHALGDGALGPVKDFLEHARLKEPPGGRPDPRAILAELINGHQAALALLAGRSELDDLRRRHQRLLWVLQALRETQALHEPAR